MGGGNSPGLVRISIILLGFSGGIGHFFQMGHRILYSPVAIGLLACVCSPLALAQTLPSYRDPDTGLVWFDDLQLHGELAPYLLNPAARGQSWEEGDIKVSDAERVITFDRPSFLGGEGSYAPYLDIQFMRLRPSQSGLYLQDETTGTGWPDNGTTYARILGSQSPFEIKHSQDLPFDLVSLDVSEYSSVVSNPVSIQFVGHLAGGGTVTHSLFSDGIYDGSGPLQDFQTITLPSTFRNLSRVVVTLNSGCHIDNLRVVVLGQEVLPPAAPTLPLLYDIDWNDWPHLVNASTGLGGSYAPKSINFGDPIVRQSIGSMTDRPLELKLGNGTPVQPGVTYEQFRIGISRLAESYFFECDVMVGAHGPNIYSDSFAIHFDGAGVHRLDFKSDNKINLWMSGASGGGNIGTYALNEVVRIGVRLDMVNDRIEVLKNGSRIYEGPNGFGNLDLRDVRVHFSDSSDGTAMAAIDNLKIHGYGITSGAGPGGPELTASPASLSFDSTETAASSVKTLRLTNGGDSVLNVSSILSSHPAFTVLGDFPVAIQPSDTLILQVLFSPTAPGTYTGSITVASNAPGLPRTIPVSGVAVSGETFRLSRQVFEETITPNTNSYTEFTITNNGANPLNWSLEPEGSDGGELTGPPVVPNDASLGQLWGHRAPQANLGGIDSFLAWSATTGSSSVKVAVIDTGVDVGHPDLAANIWNNPGEISGNGIDDDGNGFVDDVRGWDFAYNDNLPSDIQGHGTHVAGTIAAKGSNGIGVSGVAWSAAIIPVKFLSDSGSGYTSDAIEAVDYATRMGARLSNNSWGGGGYSSSLRSAIQRAATGNSLFIAAAGNDGTNNDYLAHYPSNYDNANILSVAASNSSDSLAYFSNYGLSTVDLAAPGEGILSTYPGARYRTLSGTSMATPHVSGAAVLILAQSPGAGWMELRNRLIDSADRIPALVSKVPNGRRLNVANALETAPAPWLTIPTPSGTVQPGADSVVRLNLHSSGLALGSYFQTLRFLTNNAANPVTELPFTLVVSNTVPSTPTITTQPQSLSRFLGETAILSVVASGQDLGYQWYEGLPGVTTNPIGGGTRNLLVSDLQTVGVRRFWVRVSNSFGGVNSLGATITVAHPATGAPTGLSATMGVHDNKVVVSWNPVANATSYTLRRGTSSSISSSLVIASGITGISRDDLSVSAGTTYFYWLLANGPGGDGTAAGPVTGRLKLPAPPAPASFTASEGGSSLEIPVSWASVSSATGYSLYRGTSPEFSSAASIWSGPTTQFVDRNASNYRNYYYWVVVHSADAESAPGGPALGYLRTPLPKPTGLTASTEEHGRVRLTWNAVEGANSYHVFRSIPGQPGLDLVGVSEIAEFEDDSVANGVTYVYSVRAFASVGGGEYSSHSSAINAEALFTEVDLAVGKSLSKLSGNGMFDPSGLRQSIGIDSSKMRSAAFFYQVTNRGNVGASGLLAAPGANRLFRVTQMQVAPERQNLTAKVATGRSFLTLSEGGGSISVQTTLSPSPAAKRKGSKSLKYLYWVRGGATERPGVWDTVRVEARFKK